MKTTDLPKIFDGSVKTIYGHENCAPYIFEYSDRFSIFDWGPMPDQITKKGEALTYFADFFFSYLANQKNWEYWSGPKYKMTSATNELLKEISESGVKHHGIGKVEKNRYAVNPVKVIPPSYANGKWDYSDYENIPTDALVPLEVIFRFGCPNGSSLPNRLKGNPKYCEELGIDSIPQTDEHFKKPIIEFSTKLEESDRYVSYSEAKRLACLTDYEFNRLYALTELLANRLKDLFSDIGVELWDGKFEFAFGKNIEKQKGREFTLVDSIGPDELRLSFKGISLSKENVRQLYKGSYWEESVSKSKKLADTRGKKDWKNICINEFKAEPNVLDSKDVERLSMIYLSLANTISEKFENKTVFKEAWTLDKLLEMWS